MPDRAEATAEQALQVARQIYDLLQGRGSRIQGAVLADLVSLWLAGHWDADELRAGKAGAKTLAARINAFDEWCHLIWQLMPESEREILQHIEPQGHA
jgi:hypothetical protein